MFVIYQKLQYIIETITYKTNINIGNNTSVTISIKPR